MTVVDLGVIVIGFIGVLFVLDVVAVILFGPDPDLEGEAWDPQAEPMCRCGVRGGARRHIHGSWTERSPR